MTRTIRRIFAMPVPEMHENSTFIVPFLRRFLGLAVALSCLSQTALSTANAQSGGGYTITPSTGDSGQCKYNAIV